MFCNPRHDRSSYRVRLLRRHQETPLNCWILCGISSGIKYRFHTTLQGPLFPSLTAGSLGTSPHLAKQRLLDALSSANENFSNAYDAYDAGWFDIPTIRVVKPGTFLEYRRWRGETATIGTCQVKVPAVMSNTTAQEWIMNRVELEL